MNRLYLAAAAAVALCTPVARAELKSYYISHDTREVFTSGTYVGLANPNFNHLTLLDADIPTFDHFHSIGAFVYEGDPASPDVVTKHNTRVPTAAHDAPPTWIPLSNGSLGTTYEGKLVSNPTANRLTDTTMRAVQTLSTAADGTIEHTYFASSGGRWSQPFVDGAEVALELVSLSSGLHVGSLTELDVLTSAGQSLPLGDANSINVQPVLWMNAGALPGQYAAEFRLIDATQSAGHTPYGASGVFSINVEVVPEPATVVSALLGAAVLITFRGCRLARRGS